MKIRLVIFFAFLTSFIFSYGQTNNQIIITFDDSYIDEWFAQRELFDTYNIKATFFISRPYKLTDNQIDKLKILVQNGHEAGCHGLNHIEATEENQEHYIAAEIEPALQLMSDYGFTVTSFAYPFGPSTPYLDSALTHYFTFIRKATYNYLDTLISVYSEIFAQQSVHIVTNAMGIDGNFNISMENLEDAIMYVKETGYFLVLYAHAINESGDSYSITPQYLEELFILLKKHNITSITCKEAVIR